MQRAVTLAIIVVASLVLALVITPSGDPISYFLHATLIVCVAIPCYVVGLRDGRTHAAARDITEARAERST
jgi:Sec-independent protein secretion pathway component TatC